jgi:C-terminal processing protease CtpA/Prc
MAKGSARWAASVVTAILLCGCRTHGGPPAQSARAEPQATATESATLGAVQVAPSSDPVARQFDEDEDGPDRRINRLVRVGKVWAALRWFHPYLMYRSVDWDRALIDALPKIDGAQSADDFDAAVSGMLGALRDPLTHVVREQEPSDAPEATPPEVGGEAPPPTALVEEREGGVLFVTAPAKNLPTKDVESLRAALLKAKTVIFDLRAASPNASGPMQQFLESIANVLPSRGCRGRGFRFVLHRGFPAQIGQRSRIYTTTFVQVPGESFVPPKGGVPKRVAFLINKRSILSPIILALQSAGDGIIVSEGPISEEALPSNQTALPLGEGRHAAMRVLELASREPLHADVELSPAAARRAKGVDPAAKAALTILRKPRSAPRPQASAAEEPLERRDDAYEDTRYPAVQYRLLALFRAWSVIGWFYPYRHLLDRNWDAVLREFIPKVERARDATEYGLVMSELAALVPDAHVFVFGSPELDQWLGEAAPPVAIRMIEGKPVIAALLDASAAAAGVAVGDVIVEVDGKPVEARMERYRKYVAASSPSQRDVRVAHLLASGDRGSTVELGLQGASGIKRCQLVRSTAAVWSTPRTGDVVKWVAEGIGYVDLERLERGDVDAMFERLRAARAIIFDMRGYPNMTAWSIAPRLDTKAPAQLATYRVPSVTWETIRGRPESFYSVEPPIRDGGWKYAGRTVMLIDERTVSQAEHTGLLLEAAAGTKFIGSQTAGANGDVTAAALPGGLHFTFSGLDVRHADGRQLQRVGLVPDVEIKPTIAGVRAGRDEVLERAIQYVSAP